MRPPTMAPGTEVKPPSISTGRAFSATSEIENCTPSLLPHMMPATSPTNPATDQTMTHIERMDVGAPNQLAEAVEEKREPDRRHEQDDRLLVDQRAQHHPLDRDGEH